MTRADRISCGVLAGGAGVLALALARYWGANTAYADRALVLLGAIYAAWTFMPAWRATPANPRPSLGLPPLLFAGVAFAVGTFLLIQIGPRTLLLWWLTLALFTATSGFLVARFGLARWRVMLFPLLFALFALPIPTRVLNPLQGTLQELTTRAAEGCLRAAGVAVTRSDYVLTLPGGLLGVEEACSGVRSLTALTAIAAFVAFWRGYGPARGLILLALSVPVVWAVNVARVVLSGLIQEGIGPEYIQGDWHESLGFAMVFVGLGLILAVASRLGTPAEPPPPGEPVPTPARGARRAATVSLLVLALTAWGAWAGRGTLAATESGAPLGEIAMTLGGWRGEELRMPPVVTDLLAPDVAIYRRYRNNVGREVFVYVFAWKSDSAIKGYHHPDVCWGNKGFEAEEAWVEPLGPPGERQAVDATARAFRQGGERQVVLYWNQEGRHVWTEADEVAARNDLLSSAWSGHRWVGELLGAGEPRAGARLQVVVICPGAGNGARRDAAAVASLVREELYEICPWADPGR